MNVIPFSPANGATVKLTVTSISSSSALTLHQTVKVYNFGPNKAFIRYGIGAQTALTTDMPVAPGNTELFTLPAQIATIAAVCDTGETATVYCTPGEGQ
jgi:hypothetical protein